MSFKGSRLYRLFGVQVQKFYFSEGCSILIDNLYYPTACMTWDLGESGKHFITTIVNGSDLVPTFSTASIDDLRSEVTTSSWLNDPRDQIEQTRILNVVYRSASAKARAAVAGALAPHSVCFLVHGLI